MSPIRRRFRESGGPPLVLVLALAGLAAVVFNCSTDRPRVTTPAESGALPAEGAGTDVGLAALPGNGTSPASVTRVVNAAQGAEIALGRFKIRIEPGALYKTMSVTLTVQDAARNRFQVGPAGVQLSKPMRLSMNAAGLGGTGSGGTLRFFYRGATWTPLATTRTLTEAYAFYSKFGEFSVGAAAPAGNGTVSAR